MKIKILTSLFLLFAGQASAEQAIVGFQDLSFGMSVEEVAALYSLNEEPSSGDIDQAFGTDADIKINGDKYDVAVGFSDNQLVSINVSRWLEEGDQARLQCEFEFDDIFGLIAARYGEPDQDPSVSTTDITEIRGATFTDIGGNSIKVSGISVGTSCLVVVAYIARQESNAQF